MAIQFRCPGCSQPIEVDDVNAGQTAACPYCRRVVKVPTESTLDRESPTVARPTVRAEAGHAPSLASTDASAEVSAPPPPQPMPGELHIGPTRSPRELAASRYGTYGLVCTALVLLLFGATIVLFVGFLFAEMPDDMTSQPTPAQMAAMQAAAMQKLVGDARVKAMHVGTAFFGIVGLICGIVSVSQDRRNWKGIATVVLCGLFTLCTCAELVSILGGTVIGVGAFVA